MGTTGPETALVAQLEAGHEVDRLLQLLADNPDETIGWEAAEALARLGDARAISPLLASLDHARAPTRQHAARLLGEFRAVPAVRPLIERLADRDRYVRAAAALALGQVGTPEVLEPLTAALTDKESCVRIKAAEALRLLGDGRAAPALTGALKDDDARVREAAGLALAELVPAAAADKNPPAPEHDIEWYFSLEPSAPDDSQPAEPGDEPHPGLPSEPAADRADGLIRTLTAGDCCARLIAAEQLAREGELRAIEPMIRSFAGCDAAYREKVAALLAGMGRIAHLALVQALSDRDPDIRVGAAVALGVAGVELAAEPLLRAAGDRDARVRTAAIIALPRMKPAAFAPVGAPDAFGTLVAALDDRDPLVRRSAAEALEHISWQPADPGEQARYQVALGCWEAAAALGEPALPALAAALRFTDVDARGQAARTLVSIGPGAAGLLLAELAGPSALARTMAAWALGELRSADAEAKLVAALEDPDPEVREAALVALDKLEATDRFDRLTARLTDATDFVRVTAVEVVGHLGNGRAAEAIIGRLGDESPDVRRVAAETLRGLRDPRAIRSLLRALNDVDHGVRYAAAEALEVLNRV